MSAGMLSIPTAGCLGTRDVAQESSPTTAEADCDVSSDAALLDLVPPAPENYERSGPDTASEASREEYKATTVVVSEYRDGDDAILDDLTVRLFRFREDAKSRRLLTELLTNVEFDSGRFGIGALLGRVGFVGIGPTRERARTLLLRSPALTERCLELHRVMPAETRTPDDDTPRATETST